MINNENHYTRAQRRPTLSLPFGKPQRAPAAQPTGTLPISELKRIVAAMLD